MKYFISTGLIKAPKSNKSSFVGLESLNNIIKKILTYFKVSYIDPCCPAELDNRPVKYNKTLGVLQYLDSDNTTWVNV